MCFVADGLRGILLSLLSCGVFLAMDGAICAAILAVRGETPRDTESGKAPG